MTAIRPYKAYTSYGQAMVTFSALKTGGFNSVFQNLHAAQMNMFEALALGGYWIFLPRDEHEAVRDWQAYIQSRPIALDTETDAPPQKHYVGVFLASLWHPSSIAALPIMAAIAILHYFRPKRKTNVTQ